MGKKKEYYLPYLNYVDNLCDACVFVFTVDSIIDSGEGIFCITSQPESDDIPVPELYRYLGNPSKYETIYFERDQAHDDLNSAQKRLLIQSFTQR